MGILIYGNTGLQIELDDRVLTHLQVVIIAKLRRNEGFPFSWRDPESTGDGRGSLWLHSSIPLYFRYDSHETPKINRTWLEILTISSNTAAGLRVVEEPPEQPPSARMLA